ncbi:GTPase Era [Candidatus Uhrbacteria bacterium CG_4_9_14_3_um_filter_36_7]|uniref:GTPase Era n=1 Tax=Candidatus Uhrbacteria bacterium CG_4_9_14_3_um_filter_36_7 TaxID=1975033 RepID=A0A2M7XI06_9BACT|nr:MAG: GTPase Era [Candidatus Uhrbacteria bacterium CG_4_9_14_3_um_filter_36_7]
MKNTSIFKSGFAVLIGRSNVGKSTLLNSLVGTKVAITTPKAQTTRRPIQGIIHKPQGQIIFVDTPGIFKQSRDQLSKKLFSYVKESLKDIDVVVYVVDPTRDIGAEEKYILDLVKHLGTKKIFVINKMDEKQKPYLEFYREMGRSFENVIELSAKTRENLNLLLETIFNDLPEGEPFYPEGQFTSLRHEEWLAELVREKLFLRLRQEVPYSVHVVVDETQTRENGTVYIKARVLTTDDRYKSMIIGKGGRGIKEIGQSTRKELETVMQQSVFLDLSVEVNPHWVEQFL